ncbi:MAG: thymidine phosphorylase, partial [Chloroflexi bacterium]|nr:thymidine phosphorylase [Chloroflexota bacterium]
EAQHLARSMLTVGRQAGLKVAAALTSMSQPLGRAIGNALEVAEAIDVLSGDGPSDVSLLTCHLAVELLLLAQRATSAEQAAELVDRALRSGSALQRFSDLVQAQGGDRRIVDTPALLPKARVQQAVRAPRGGFVRGIDARKLGYAAVSLGAGRQRKGEAINHAVGFILKAKVGEAVAQNEPLAIVHASSEPAAERAAAAVIAAYDLGDAPPVVAGLVARMLR